MSRFADPSYLTIRSSVYISLIWDPYIFNLYNLWRTRCIHIRQFGLHFNEQITRTHFLVLQPSIKPVPAQVILLWKRPPKLCIKCHLVPVWAFPPKSPSWNKICCQYLQGYSPWFYGSNWTKASQNSGERQMSLQNKQHCICRLATKM